MNSNHNTIKEAAQRWRMSEAWVRKQVFERKIRFLKIGSRVFIPESTIEDVLNCGIVEPAVKEVE